MTNVLLIMLIVLGVIVGIIVAAVLVIYLIVPIFRGIGWVIARIFQFVGGELADVARSLGAVITSIVLVPLVLGTVVIGRWSASTHFARAIQREIGTLGACLYRIVIGHPARLVGLTGLTEGLEHRIPEVVRGVPGPDKPSARIGQFEGYKIIGSLTGGGSGGKLYIAEPDAIRRAALERQGFTDVDRVVIKAFSLHDGSTLPQIIRESRALEAAKNLGFVLDHDLSPERFFYITRYVPGESLGVVTQQLHASSPGGLEGRGLGRAIKYTADLLRTLETYHEGGLWHKDIKPDNIVVHNETAHVVDLGLVTPLRSAMTLTTHGTEYFRDPEMVRMALRGVKVHQVDGAKFDIYAAGAVLFSMIENSFPAHGGLSQISKRCPESIRWIVRRAMADYDKRYPTASAMLADLEVVLSAKDPFVVRPVDLPSVGGAGREGSMDAEATAADAPGASDPFDASGAGVGAAAGVGAGVGVGGMADVGREMGSRKRPKIRMRDWWSGRYTVEGEDVVATDPSKRARVVASSAMASVASVMQRAADQLGQQKDQQKGQPKEQAHAKRAGAGDVGVAGAGVGGVGVGARRSPQVRAIPDRARRPAAEQLRSARERAAAARERAKIRMRSSPVAGRGGNGGRGGRVGREVGGPNGGMAIVAATIGVGLLMCVGIGGYVIKSALEQNERVRVVAEVGSPAGVSLDGRGALPAPGVTASQALGRGAIGRAAIDGGAAEGAAEGGSSIEQAAFQQRVSEATQLAMARVHDLQAALRDAGQLAGIAAQSPGGRVVVVNDALPPLSRNARSLIDGAVARLIAFEFDLVGNVPGIDVDGDELEDQISLVAAVRNARGQLPLDSEACRGAFEGLLDRQSEAVDAIIWISPEGNGRSPTFHLFIDRRGSAGRDELLHRTLMAALSPEQSGVATPGGPGR